MSVQEATITVPCSEPACDSYESGHDASTTTLMMGDQIDHVAFEMTEDKVTVSVRKFGDEPWRVDFFLEGATDPHRAKVFAEWFWDAAAKCRDLNATSNQR